LPSNNDKSAGLLEARVKPTGEVITSFLPETKLGECSAHAAWLGFGLVSDVRRGENAGRALRHDFVVLQHASTKLVPDSDGNWTARLDAPHVTDKAGALAVWVEANAIPVQAAGGWLNTSPD
jgi:hypothetical protein